MRDVIIVGGGVSGLYAAQLLRAASLDIQLIEGSSRIGGRLHTVYTPEGYPVDLGGQWIGQQHQRALQWIESHRIPLHPTHTKGYHLFIEGTSRRRYKGIIPRLSWIALAELGWALSRLKKMSRHVSVEKPWQIVKPAWDETTLAAWMRRTFRTRQAYQTCAVGLATVLGCEPEEVSLWHTLFYIQSAGSLEALIQIQGGAQEFKFSKGASSLTESLAEEIPIMYSDPVQKVEWKRGKVRLFTKSGRHWDAHTVLFAIPPARLSSIEFEPPLPPLHSQLAQHMRMGTITKVVAIYDKPFWREDGLSGHVLKLDGALRITFDTSPPDDSYGQLTGFGTGKLARHLLSRPADERKEYYQKELEAIFEKAPRQLYQKTWSEEPLIGGCYAGYFGPGGWQYVGETLRQHLPPLYWTGTERASIWMGYIEGAFRAAENVCETLLQKKVS
ncbi:MAG: NAD(P)/FAD-dependent oxidoreductase [Bacteroidia bacterium]|nr:FAD-dependent oxidoreductase [Bacteroidia bacterium]MDW8015477.1 NAD(P)/FAD-dependent oxidoreductase [Bacteroidia bacterium]